MFSPLRFSHGFGYFVRGWQFLRHERPDLRGLVIWPTLLSLILFLLLLGASFGRFGQIRRAVLPARPVYAALLTPLLFVAVVMAAALVFLIAQAAIAAPFKELLSAKVEAHLTGRAPRSNTFWEMVAGIGHELVKLLIFAGLMVGIYAIGWIVPVVGPVLIVAGGPLVTAYFLAFDHADHAPGREGKGFSEKWRFFAERRSVTLGFGAAIGLWLMIPVLGAITLPAAAVGGTLLYLEQAGRLPPQD